MPSDRRVRRTGLRQIRMKRWIATVNGERLFLKGANLGPTRMALGQATAADLENLGEAVRKLVAEDSGITLRWEVKRVGHKLSS